MLWIVLVVAFLMAGTVTAIVILGTGRVPGASAPAPSPTGARPSPTGAGPAPAVSMAGARSVLAAYAIANDEANRARSEHALAAIEAGSSYALDSGLYRWMRAIDPGNTAYAPLKLDDASFYIPLLPRASYPRWFAARVEWVPAGASPGTQGPGYILFTQARPGGPWLDVLEPYAITGAPVPHIALDAAGFATAVAPNAAGGLASPPASLPAMTASTLNGSGTGILDAGMLRDVHDAAFWSSQLPAGSSVSDVHSPMGNVYALRTTDGGALVLYAGSAVLHLAAPQGQALHITVPGFYSASQAEPSAELRYTEQFATLDPPAELGTPQVIAEVAGPYAR